MSMKTILLILFSPLHIALAQVKKAPPRPATHAPKAQQAMTGIDSLSYCIGLQVAQYYKAQGVEQINAEYLKKAFGDVLANRDILFTDEQANMTIQQKLQEYMSKKISAEKEKGATFLEANKSRPGVITLPSGLQYEIINKGSGAVPKITDTVSAHYRGTLLNGDEFDNSYKRGEPLTIPVSGVIRGWTEALQLMPVGSKWKLYIPSDLAYGDRGAGGVIPGGAILIFEIELLDIINK